MAKTRRATAKRGKTDDKPGDKARGKPRMLIVEARYYNDIADALLRGATKALDEAGAQREIITVPGALEIPAAIAIAVDAASAKRAPYDGVVALGCVIYGETYHFEIVANESARGLMNLSVNRGLPIGNGILTVETEAQAHARAGGDVGDKGAEAARAALTLVTLKQSLAGR
jgi:6,7-dimethyl-8-ribityllumazine synthase